MDARPPLGRGLATLLPNSIRASNLQDLSLDQIQPDPGQPRKVFDHQALEDLASSIRHHGLIQPLIVRQFEGGYIIVAGERRWRAAKMAGLERVPAVVREPGTSSPFELALVENLQRQDLNPVDEALAYQHLLDAQGTGQNAVATVVGKSRSHVANMLRLLDLPGEALSALRIGTISAGHGRAVLMVSDPDARLPFFSRMVQEKWSVRRAEMEARKFRTPKQGSIDSAPLKPYFDQVAQAVEASLGFPVKIRSKKNRGVLEIPFDNLGALKELSQKIAPGISLGDSNKSKK